MIADSILLVNTHLTCTLLKSRFSVAVSLCAAVENMEAGIQLNQDVYSIFTDKFDDTSCVALALSGIFDGFPSVFTETRFINQHII